MATTTIGVFFCDNNNRRDNREKFNITKKDFAVRDEEREGETTDSTWNVWQERRPPRVKLDNSGVQIRRAPSAPRGSLSPRQPLSRQRRFTRVCVYVCVRVSPSPPQKTSTHFLHSHTHTKQKGTERGTFYPRLYLRRVPTYVRTHTIHSPPSLIKDKRKLERTARNPPTFFFHSVFACGFIARNSFIYIYAHLLINGCSYSLWPDNFFFAAQFIQVY